MKKIIDEFTDLPVSRTRKYQLRLRKKDPVAFNKKHVQKVLNYYYNNREKRLLYKVEYNRKKRVEYLLERKRQKHIKKYLGEL